MIRLSSNLTLFFKVFIPTFWIIFFGSLSIAIVVADGMSIFPVDEGTQKGIVLGFFLLFFILIFFTVIPLKRIEIDTENLFVTNYFKSFKYPISDIENVSIKNWGIFKTLHFHFKGKTSFGKRIFCLMKYTTFKQFLSNNPGLLPFR